jgi:hypothetical protein
MVQFLYLLAAGLMKEVRFLTARNYFRHRGSGAHPASYPMGSMCSFPRGKAAEVKNAWPYTSTPSYVSVALGLIEHKDNFTFTLPSIVLAREGSRAKLIDWS